MLSQPTGRKLGKRVINTATAKCSSKDTFDFETGAKLAFERLMVETKWRVVNRPARKGDYVRIINPCFSFNKVGDILKVHDVFKCGSVLVKACDHHTDTGEKGDYVWCYLKEHVEVVEPVTDEKEKRDTPKYYNGKVVCTKSHTGFTVGKVYEFVDGRVTDVDGDKRPISKKIKSLEEYNGYFYNFIPYVE